MHNVVLGQVMSWFVFIPFVLSERHVALLAASSGVSAEDDSSGAIMNQQSPVQTTTAANL